MKNRTLAILLTVILASGTMMAGCGSTSKSDKTDSAASTSSTSSAADSASSAVGSTGTQGSSSTAKDANSQADSAKAENLSSKAGDFVTNPDFEGSKLKTVSGREIDVEACRSASLLDLDITSGMGLCYPEKWSSMATDKTQSYIPIFFSGETDGKSVSLGYLTEASFDENAKIDGQNIMEYMVPVCALAKTEKGGKVEDRLLSIYGKSDYLGTINDMDYYFCYNDNIEASQGSKFTDKDKENFKLMADTFEELKNNVVLSEVEDRPEEIDYDSVNEFANFQAEDLDGNKVTDKDIKKNKLTMINIWETACGPCVEEMPELAALNEKLPEGVGMIGICADGDTEKEQAKEIIKDAGCKYPTLMVSKDLANFMDKVYAFPTTIFVDSHGKVLGEYSDKLIADDYLEAINSYLKELK